MAMHVNCPCIVTLAILAAVGMLLSPVQGDQVALHTAPDMTEEEWNSKCDTTETSWLITYMRWAKEQRSKGIPAAGVKYLVWSCELPPGKSAPPTFCHNLSDRLRGIMTALSIAAATGRLLLVHQTVPVSLQTFLEPHLIDWSVQQEQLPALWLRTLQVTHSNFCKRGIRSSKPHPWDPHTSCQLQGAPGQAMEEQFVFMESSQPPGYPPPGLPRVMHNLHQRHCAFTALFKASPQTEQAALLHMALMGLQPGATPYAALNIHRGGWKGELVDDEEHHERVSLHELARAVDCTGRYAARRGIDRKNKLVLVSDNLHLLQMVITDNVMPELAAVPGSLASWDRSTAKDLPALLEMMADLVVLARAKCLMHSRGGLALVAEWWSGTNCSARLQECP